MAQTTLVCEQAIFTSIRTPMGEGYRIIAASKGINPKDKQMITQRSPSHDGLCAPENNDACESYVPLAVSFYQLPSGLLCVAISCFAGAEHTGRGGQRIYTHCAVFPSDQFKLCAFNPFNMAQAMVEAGLTTPTLKPKPQLEPLSLQVNTRPTTLDNSCVATLSNNNAYLIAIERILRDKAIIVNLDNDWLVATEAIMMSLPGPMRERVSFGAGLRYSTGRHFNLNMLSDETGVSKSRSAGQPIEYFSSAEEIASIPKNPWLNFIERMWKKQSFEDLAKRTAPDFNNTSEEGRALIANLYDSTDALVETEAIDILKNIQRTTSISVAGVEAQLLETLLDSAASTLCLRLNQSTWTKCQPYWSQLMDIARASEMYRQFSFKLIPLALQAATKENIPQAFTLALQVARLFTNQCSQEEGHPACVMMVLEQTKAWLAGGGGENIGQIHGLCDEWKTLYPAKSIIEEIASLCREKLATTPSQ